MRLKNYLTEGARSMVIDMDKTIELLMTKCPKVLENGYTGDTYTERYFRGVEENDDYYLVNPNSVQTKRKSTDNPNYYTLFTSNAKSWNKFPRRDSSIIMTNDIYLAEDYGNPYLVFPFDGSLLGIAPVSDFWGSFKKTMPSGILQPNNLTKELKKTFQDELNNTDDTNFRVFFENLKKLDKIFTTPERALDWSKDRYNSGKIRPNHLDPWTKAIPYKGNMWKWLDALFDPQKNGFKIGKAGTDPIGHTRPGHEIWTEGKCVMVASEVWSELAIHVDPENRLNHLRK